jgi:hypothetical protein
VNASQRVTLVVFGRKAKKLAEDLGVNSDSLRNALTPDELILLQEVEDTSIMYLAQNNPQENIRDAVHLALA